MNEYPRTTLCAALLGLFLLHRKFVHHRITLPPSPTSRRILVTGGASGIGLATAALFKSRGWIVGLADINKDACEAARAKISADACYRLNVVDSGECRLVCEAFVREFGGIDALFNSAGLLTIGLFADEPIDKQTKQVRVNFEGVCNMTHAALEHMKPSGRVVTMASGSAVAGIPNHAVYSATKVAVYHLTEALNMELHPRGISVADVSVMYVSSPMVHDQRNLNTRLLQQPSTFIKPERVAATVWEAVHEARLHREHFYVGLDLLMAFKSMALFRFLGLRLGARIVYLTNMPLASL